MVKATFNFPRGFLWGSATSSHQVEGYNTLNNWWAWEQEPGRILKGHKSGAACDWWGGHWRDDFDRAAESGQNAHRFSIEWSRIQPLPDKWDLPSLDRYREMARGLHERGITPMVTLHHFSDPIWLADKGGWEDQNVVEFFIPFVRKVVDALGDYVNLWVTINEPDVYSVLGYLLGDFPPGNKQFGAAVNVMTNMLRAHAAAYHAIHEIQPNSRVGLAINFRDFLPARSKSPLDRWTATIYNRMFNDFFPYALRHGKLTFPTWRTNFPEAKGTQDFLGINYYTQELVSFDIRRTRDMFSRRFLPSGAEVSETGFIANCPQGMFRAINWGRQFNVPMIVTENGVDDSQDSLRPQYLIQHLHQIWRAVNINFPVKGYFHWTLVDNFEWERGWTQRFGLWELDVQTQARKKRSSADLYAEICRTNGISSDIVAQYAPQVFDQLFPV